MAELFDRVIRASEILSCDSDFRSNIRKMLEKLDPYHIGPDGRLLEWDGEYDEAEPEHRHVSHLFSLFPGKNISVSETPELARACRKVLKDAVTVVQVGVLVGRPAFMQSWATETEPLIF